MVSRLCCCESAQEIVRYQASGTYVCTRELTHLESHPFLSLANRVSIGERYGYMSMVV